MDSVMAIATGMRYVQNVLAATHPGVPAEGEAGDDSGGATVEPIEPHDPGDDV